MTIVQIVHSPIATSVRQYQRNWEVENYRHRLSATMGFDTCSFDIHGTRDEMEEFFFSGLGRQVTRYSNDGGYICWQGQIMSLTLNEPGFQMRVSLDEMFNRIIVRYIPIDTSTNPPTESAETSTTAVNNAASQAKYGVKELIYRPAHITRLNNADATQQGDILLGQYKEPRRSGQISSGDNDPKLFIECEGYMHTLDWVVYNQTVSSGTDNLNTLVAAVLATTCGQFVASSDTSNSTGLSAQKYFNRDDTGLTVVQTLASLGDTGLNRWLCNMFEDRKIVYSQSYDINSNIVSYYRSSQNERQEIRDLFGRIIPPWELRPGKWIRTMDVFPWYPTPATLPEDYTALYIEAIDWSEPDSLQLQGSPGDKLQVILARQANQGDVLL